MNLDLFFKIIFAFSLLTLWYLNNVKKRLNDLLKLQDYIFDRVHKYIMENITSFTKEKIQKYYKESEINVYNYAFNPIFWFTKDWRKFLGKEVREKVFKDA